MNDMYEQLMWVICNSGMKRNVRLVAMALAHRSTDETSKVRATHPRLAMDCGLGEKPTMTAIRSLESICADPSFPLSLVRIPRLDDFHLDEYRICFKEVWHDERLMDAVMDSDLTIAEKAIAGLVAAKADVKGELVASHSYLASKLGIGSQVYVKRLLSVLVRTSADRAGCLFTLTSARQYDQDGASLPNRYRLQVKS